jgi:hypothetical protein
MKNTGVTLDLKRSTIGFVVRKYKQGKIYLVVDDVIQGLLFDMQSLVYPGVVLDSLMSIAYY